MATDVGEAVAARSPGRVNLIGDHTDYTSGLVLPMAIDRWTTVAGVHIDGAIRLRSASQADAVDVTLPVGDPATVEPPWGRYAAGVAWAMKLRDTGIDATVSSTIPVGAGLSSSAALEVATALALGFDGSALDLARTCQRAEQRASGVPCGIMDQYACAAGVKGHATLIDCHSLAITPVAIPADAEVAIIHSGVHRSLPGSAYAERTMQCAAAEAEIGPLRLATIDDVARITDPVIRARARHVVTENARVRAFAAAVAAGELAVAGRLMVESHESLRDDYAVSTPELDALVDRLRSMPGVFGARLTGAGFGGCVVALTRPGAVHEGWVAKPVAGATVL